MELIRGIHNLRPEHQNCVLTIGNFDGVHLGHQAVLKQVIEKSKAMRVASCVMLFEPQPREFFAQTKKQTAPARITNLREKYLQLSRLGIDRLVIVKFSLAFANLTADDFIQELLVKKMGVKFLIVGDDFHFGAKQQGNFSYLTKHAPFDVMNTQSFKIPLDVSTRVSSTAIRALLNDGLLTAANAMFGREYSMIGRVSHGRKLGRSIGFPTANIAIKRLVSPLSGVFVVKVFGIDDKIHYGVANIGTRPTVDGNKTKLEVHLFDFGKDIYGKLLQVEFLHKLRDEQKFNSIDELTKQIKFDALAARKWLERN